MEIRIINEITIRLPSNPNRLLEAWRSDEESLIDHIKFVEFDFEIDIYE